MGKFDSRWRFDPNLRFLTTPYLQNIEFGKIHKFESCCKFCSNLRVLTTLVLWTTYKIFHIQGDSHFLILPNFMVRSTRVVKNLKSKQNFQRDWNLLTFFMFCWTQVVKNIKFESNFQRNWNSLILANFIVHRTEVVKNLKLEQNLQRDSKLIIFFKFAGPGW